MRRRLTVVALASFLLAGLIVVVSASAISRGGRDTGFAAWAPGVAAEVGAMHRLAPVSNPPDRVRAVVQHVAQVSSDDAARAMATLRKLRSGLGSARATIYAFQPDANATCMVVPNQGFACPTSAGSHQPGLVWMAGGGYPAWAEGGPTAPTLVGIAADNIRSLKLVENGRVRAIEIKNNAFYAELDFDQATSSRSSIQLQVEYVDGETTPIPVGP